MSTTVDYNADDAIILFQVDANSTIDDVTVALEKIMAILDSSNSSVALISAWLEGGKFPPMLQVIPTAQKVWAHSHLDYICVTRAPSELAYWLQVLNKLTGRSFLKFDSSDEAATFVKKAREVSTKRVPPTL
jgi:hypothetical protein